MSIALPVPETRVLAVASHVVSGNVGNKIAVFAMQSLGCDVAALNTVQFSNHTGYKQWKGTRVSAQEITDLWEGLKLSYLDDFDMMLTGYIPGAPAVEAVGRIAQELKEKAASDPASFFWVLDPVMGDNGRLYVAPDVVPEYKKLLVHADLILPNQFEAELLSDTKIDSMASLERAIEILHTRYQIPHVVITSVSFPTSAVSSPTTLVDGVSEQQKSTPAYLSVVGSTMTSSGAPRLFKIVFPAIDAYFSGTGDMFAALMVVRIREAVHAASVFAVLDGGDEQASPVTITPLVKDVPSWISPDEVDALKLPLARAAEKVLASMHEVLSATSEGMKSALEGVVEEDPEKLHLMRSRASEVRLVRSLASLREPTTEFRATKID